MEEQLMDIEHNGQRPQVDGSTFIAVNAVLCGQVKIGRNCRVMYGASIIAEGGQIVIGDNCVILENAVLRSTEKHDLTIGNHVLIGPHTHLVGCEVADEVFIATGASVFHGAKLESGCEVRINGVVHIMTLVSENSTIPIGWVAVGNPARIFSPDRHEEIWEIQKTLNFPGVVYGVERGDDIMQRILRSAGKMLGSHETDKPLS
jgi:carbonic anhydrase/acetyltransferase-like protein (isoleucine patch superfamily)